MLELLAKSNPCETIGEHTGKLLKGLDDLLCLYGDFFNERQKGLIRCACEYHDYGKSSYAFQSKRMHNKNLPVDSSVVEFYKSNKGAYAIPHGYLSPAFMPIKELKSEFGEDDLGILIRSIVHHHVRKFEVDSKTKDLIKKTVENDLKVRFPDLHINLAYIKKIIVGELSVDLDKWIRYAKLVGLLNRLDYHASSGVDEKFEIPHLIDGKSAGELLTESFSELRDVQKYMGSHKDDNVVVVASTGIGKTEAALLWAGDGKLFYTLPLKISINAIYERIRAKYGRVILLHSDSLSYLLNKENEAEENECDAQDFDKMIMAKYKMSKFLSYPITISTVDQLFLFIYKVRGYEQLLSPFAYSKIVIDEIQAYSPDLVGKILCGLSMITRAGGKFAIMTATLPPVFVYFMKKLKLDFEPSKPFLSDLRRHFISYREMDDFDLEFIADEAVDKKVLVICNTIKKARSVYSGLAELGCDAHLLHSEFLRKDRALLEDAIMKFEGPGVWVSTQIVEASLDVDFDVLFTEMCPADNLLQRLGRCYRKRDYSGDSPNVFVCDIRNSYRRIYDSDIYKRSVDALEKYNDSFFDEKDKIDYVNRVYDTEALKDTNYFKQINESVDKIVNNVAFVLDKNDAMRDFRKISSRYVVPDCVYDANVDVIDELIGVAGSNAPISERIKAEDRLKDFAIPVSYCKYDKLVDRNPVNPKWARLKFDLFRIKAGYEFDESSLTGRGLYPKDDDDNEDLFL